jgi:hypothetical protein
LLHRLALPLLLPGFVAAVGCSRASSAPPEAGVPTEPAPSSSEVASSSAPAPPPPPAPTLPPIPPAPPGEAQRKTVQALEADQLLVPQLARLRTHFQVDGGTLRGPFVVQRIERSGGGDGVLVSRADESDPFAMALDRGQLVFSKERPVAGITPPVQHVTIAPGPERGIVLFGYVATLHLVAARMWADDGNPFAEIVALEAPACDALAAAYWPGNGWLLACSSKDGTRTQLLRENLTSAWGTAGLVLGNAGPVASARIAIDSPTEWTLVQRARAVGGDRTLTFRYDAEAQPVAQSGAPFGPSARPSAGPQPMPSSSTSKTSVELGGMTGGNPRAP